MQQPLLLPARSPLGRRRSQQDPLVAGVLLAPRPVTLGGDAPWRHRRPPTSGATAMWVINGVHSHATHGGADAPVAVDAGLADDAVFVLRVGDGADGRAARQVEQALLACAQQTRTQGCSGLYTGSRKSQKVLRLSSVHSCRTRCPQTMAR